MKKSNMSIASNGKAVMQPGSQAPETKTATQEAAAPGTEVMEPEPQPEPQPEQQPETQPQQVTAAIPAAPAPEPEREPVDTRTIEQKVADLQKQIDERQKLISRFNDLSNKHFRFTQALEEITPDDCEVIIRIDGRRFTSTDPVAVRRFIVFQVESFAAELSQVANSLLI